MKNKNQLFCIECGYEFSQWMGQCFECKSWNSIKEKSEKVDKNRSPKKIAKKINQIKNQKYHYYKTGHESIDNVLGDGPRIGSVVLISGHPGVGKTTLLLSISSSILKQHSKTIAMYVSGEESESQLVSTCKRLGIDDERMYILSESSSRNVYENIEKIKPKILVLDSLQTIYDVSIEGVSGGAKQTREFIYYLLDYAKSEDMLIFIVGHVNKEGDIAGPKYIEHMVDVVLRLEKEVSSRVLTLSATKNRYSSLENYANLKIDQNGIHIVKKNKALNKKLLNEKKYIGLANTLRVNKNIRSVSIEVITEKNKLKNGKLSSEKIKGTRLEFIKLILKKYLDIDLALYNIYIDIVDEDIDGYTSSMDIAIIMSIISAIHSNEIPSNYYFLGKVRSSGEVHAGEYIVNTLHELDKESIGFTIITSQTIKTKLNKLKNIQVKAISSIIELLTI